MRTEQALEPQALRVVRLMDEMLLEYARFFKVLALNEAMPAYPLALHREGVRAWHERVWGVCRWRQAQSLSLKNHTYLQKSLPLETEMPYSTLFSLWEAGMDGVVVAQETHPNLHRHKNRRTMSGELHAQLRIGPGERRLGSARLRYHPTLPRERTSRWAGRRKWMRKKPVCCIGVILSTCE